MKRILFVLLLCLFMMPVVTVSASDTDAESYYGEPDYDDPDYIKILHKTGDEVVYNRKAYDFISPYTGLFYGHNDRFKDKPVVHGIDVSKWQGEIDFKKVKSAGIQFVFIRCGYTAVNNPFRTAVDPYFDKNIKAAYDAGLKVGVYYFSNAKSLKEVKSEVNQTLKLIQPYKNMISLPVVYDYEAFTDDYRAYGTSRKIVTENAAYFCGEIQSHGYEPMYYGCPDVLQHTMDANALKSYKCWLANYTSETKYDGAYSFWQYSESGRVSGIQTPVDCDYYYDDGTYGFTQDAVTYDKLVSGFRMSIHTKSWIKLRWRMLPDCDGYKIYRSNSYDGTYKKIKTLSRDMDFYKDTGLSSGREYYYRIIPYKKHAGAVLYGKPSYIVSGYTDFKYKTKIKAVVDLNIRAQAGSGYDKTGVLMKGTSVKPVAYVIHNGVKWYKINYQGATGYVSGAYVKVLKYGNVKRDTYLYKSAGGTGKLCKAKSGKDAVIIKTKTKNRVTWAYVRYNVKHGWIKLSYLKQI